MKATAITFLAGLAPGIAFAESTYECGFQVVDNVAKVTLSEKDTRWQFEDESGSISHFAVIPGSENREAIHLFSTDFDTDADAVAMLSVSTVGDARLSAHGFFPGFDATTVTGSCHPKEP